jgi:hypothetical protein
MSKVQTIHTVQTIQLTSKTLKAQLVLSVLLGLTGLGVLFFGDQGALGPVLSIMSILWFFMVKILIWWNHA